MPRTARLNRHEVKSRLRYIRGSYLRARRLLEAEHGDSWHQHTERLERYEARGLELTRLLPSCPAWWTLPCECRACKEDG